MGYNGRAAGNGGEEHTDREDEQASERRRAALRLFSIGTNNPAREPLLGVGGFED